MFNEKELLEKMNKDKDYRADVLINLNAALQQAQRVTADDYDEWEKFEEFKIAVVSLEIEKQELQSRIKKAIKHVEEKTYNGMFELYDSTEDEGISDLLRILRGKKIKEEYEKK